MDQNRIVNRLINNNVFVSTGPNIVSEFYMNKDSSQKKWFCKILVRDAAIGQHPDVCHHKVRRRKPPCSTKQRN